MTEPILIRKSPVVIIKNLIALQFAVAVMYFLAALAANYGEIYDNLGIADILSYEIAKFLFILGAEAALLAIIFLRWLYTVYTFHPHSLVRERGILFKDRETIPLIHPVTIAYEYAPLSQIFAYGTLVVRVPDREKPIQLVHVQNPDLYSRVIRDMLSESADDPDIADGKSAVSFDDLLKNRERENLEFKATLRWDLHAQKVNRDLEHAAIKTAAAFLNSGGGHLVIGMDDGGAIRGLNPDFLTLKKQNLDGFENHFTNIFNEMIGAEFRHFVRLSFPESDGKRVCVAHILPATKPAYVRSTQGEIFYIRTGNSTTALPVSAASSYIRSRWKKY